MATLFEINADIGSCIDFETGEILEPEKLEQLKMDKHEKLRNIAFVALNAKSDAEAYKEQERRFKAKRTAAEKTLAWAKETLARELGGQKMKEAEFSVSFRKSETVEVADEAAVPDEFRIPQPDKIDKAALKAALKNGAVIAGAQIVERQNIQIK